MSVSVTEGKGGHAVLLEYEHLLDSTSSSTATSTSTSTATSSISTARVVYRSVSSNAQYVVLGANTGSLYFYERESFRFLALISCKEIREPIAKLKFGPAGSTVLSLCTSKNTIFLLEINLNNRKEKEKIIYKYTHKEGILKPPICLPYVVSDITFIEWDHDAQTLFFSDDIGTISAIPLTKAKSLFFSPEFVYKCDSSVVQLSCSDNQLLASSLTRCTVINFAKHTSLQIGSQLRDGKFGACFHPDKSVGNYLLAARPGKRLWLADCDLAEVRKTLSFKDSLSSDPTPILPPQYQEHLEVNPASTIFSRLVPITPSLILAWETNAIFLIDLTVVDIPEWHTDITNIQDISVFGNSLFILHGENKHVAKLTLKVESNQINNESSQKGNDLASPKTDIPILKPTENPQMIPDSPVLQEPPKIKQLDIEGPPVDNSSKKHMPDPAPSTTDNIESNEQFPEALVVQSSVRTKNNKNKPKNKKRKPSKIPVILPATAASNPSSTSTSPSSLPRSSSDIDLFKTSEVHSSPLTHRRSQSSTVDQVPLEEPKKPEDLHEKENKQEKNLGSKQGSVLPMPLKEGLRLFASKTRGLDQFTNFIKDPFISDKKDAKLEAAESPKPEATQDASAFHKLTKMTYEALSNYRHQKDKSVPSVLAFIEHWITFLSDKSDLDVPSFWVTEILTTYIELRLSCDGGKLEQWTESSLLDFLDRFYVLLHHPRVFFICNQLQLEKPIQHLHGLEDKYRSTNNLSKDTIRDGIEELINQKDGQGALNVIRSTNLSISLRYLKQIFLLVPKGVVEYCVVSYPSIKPWNIEFAKVSAPSYYLLYLTELMNAQTECRRDASLVESWFECNLTDMAPPIAELCQPHNSRLPRKGTHLRKWKHKDILDTIIDNPTVYTYSPTRLKLLCEKYGYFVGLIKLYIRSNQIRKAITFLLETDDCPTLLSLICNIHDTAEWKFLLAQMEKLEQEEPRSITRESVIQLMIISIGIKSSLEILIDRPQFSSLISPTIFKTFIQKGTIEEQQQDIVHSVLEFMDSYLWSQRPTTFAPQVRAILAEETQNQPIPFVTSNLSRSHRLNFDYNTEVPRFYEELKSHWGVPTPFSQGRCTHCTLPLKEQVGTVPNLVIFSCGHSFHQHCISYLDACSVCLNNVSVAVKNVSPPADAK